MILQAMKLYQLRQFLICKTKPIKSLASAAVNSYRLVNLSHSQWFIRVGYKVNMEWNQLHDRHLNFILQLRP